MSQIINQNLSSLFKFHTSAGEALRKTGPEGAEVVSCFFFFFCPVFFWAGFQNVWFLSSVPLTKVWALKMESCREKWRIFSLPDPCVLCVQTHKNICVHLDIKAVLRPTEKARWDAACRWRCSILPGGNHGYNNRRACCLDVAWSGWSRRRWLEDH